MESNGGKIKMLDIYTVHGRVCENKKQERRLKKRSQVHFLSFSWMACGLWLKPSYLADSPPQPMPEPRAMGVAC